MKTPCLGICSATSLGDAVCRGCKRFSFEVIDWNTYGAPEKKAVLERIDKLVVQIMEARFVIHSSEALVRGMKAQGVPVNPGLSPYCWLHNLLKKRHGRIQDLSQYGAGIREAWADRSLDRVWEQADEELLRLCEAHLTRFFPATASI